MIFSFDKEYKIPSTASSPLSPTINTISVLQSLAADHSDFVNYSPQWFSDNSLAWFIIDWHIVFQATPKENSIVKGSTWSIAHRRLQAHRSFILTDEDNNIILKALTKWALINTNTRRPTKPTEEMMSRYGAGKEEIFPNETFSQEVPKSENLSSTELILVNESHIDVNNHLNNIVYMGWHEDLVLKYSSKNIILLDLKVHYHKEAYKNDSIRHNLFRTSNSSGSDIYISQFVKNDNPDHIHCQITSTWR